MPTPKDRNSRPGPLQRLWEQLVGQWVSNVPAEIMVCEFECRKAQCLQGEWDTCEHRILRSADQRLGENADEAGGHKR